MVWGALGSLVGSLGGYFMDRSENHHMAKKEYLYNKELQQQNIDWQKEAMQNSHQWAVEDLKKAGLNPAIASNSAATTGGASAGASTSGGGSIPSMNNTITSAGNLMKTISEKDLLDTQSENTKEDTRGKELNNDLVQKYGDKKEQAQLEQTNVTSAKIRAEKEKTENESQLVKAQTESASAQAYFDNKNVQWVESYGISRDEAIKFLNWAASNGMDIVKLKMASNSKIAQELIRAFIKNDKGFKKIPNIKNNVK